MNALPHRPLVVGILNVTPDSFSDGGQFSAASMAVRHAERMMEDGADLVDLGGESTRPGASPVDEAEELRRVLPIARALSSEKIPFSIDTIKPAVAEQCLSLGACAVNDISGLCNPEMVTLCEAYGCSAVIMHMKGNPATMQDRPAYEGNVTEEVLEFLLSRAEQSQTAGISREKVWLDPGIGFGKSTAQNLEIIDHLAQLVESGYPIYLGVSRKRFLGVIAGSEQHPAPVEERLAEGLKIAIQAQIAGVKALRVHDVKETVLALCHAELGH